MSQVPVNLVAQPPRSTNGPLRQVSGKHPRFTLVFSFYAPDDNELAMPIAVLSSYVKQELPGVDVLFRPVLPKRDPGLHSPEGFARHMKELRPDLLAFSLMSPHWHSMDPYLLALKREVPDLPVLVGGYQALLSSEETIEHPAVDYICVGDGEQPLVDLIEALHAKRQGPIAGLWGPGAGGELVKMAPVLTEDLAEKPFPDYELFERNGGLREVNLSMFGRHDQLILPTITGRGCPYRCTYCCNTPLLEQWRGKGRFLRKYDPHRLVEELARLRERYGVGFFEFWDELFMSNMRFAREFIELYGRRIGVPFSINARVEKMDEDFCQAAADAGCHTIWFGLETGSEGYREEWLGRSMSNEQIVSAADNARRAGIHRHTFNMVGMPFETREDMLKTLEINRTIRPEFFWFFTYIPLRGTPMYKVADEAGLLLPKVGDDFSAGQRDGGKAGDFRLNLREQPGAATNDEFRQVCLEMLAFQRSNNRVSFAGRRAARVHPELLPA